MSSLVILGGLDEKLQGTNLDLKRNEYTYNSR